MIRRRSSAFTGSYYRGMLMLTINYEYVEHPTWMRSLWTRLVVIHCLYARFLQIRLGSESCDQISASPNRLKPAKSRDKTAGSLFTRVYTLVEFSQTKRCFFSFLKQNIQRQIYTSTSLSFTQHNSYFVKNKIIILFFLFICLFCLRSTNAIERRHWLLASVSIASVLSEHHLFVYVRHIWSAIVWGAPSIRKKGIKRLEHQKI